MILIKNQEINTKLPELVENTIGDSIVLILMQEWPLTTNGIIFRLKQESKKNFTPQATYKAIKKLRQNQIITKNGKYYLLNKDWLNEINQVSRKLIRSYTKNNICLENLP
jgi:hypothetical protein